MPSLLRRPPRRATARGLLAALFLGLAAAAAGGAGCRAAAGPALETADTVSLPEDVLRRLSRSVAHLLKAPAGRLRVVAATRVDWPDASLGCPQPGIFYTQVVTPGWRVVVSDGDVRHDVHADAEAYRVLVCP